jgi:hypothetical protein
MKKHLLFVLSVCVVSAVLGQQGKYSLADSIKVNALLDSSKRYINAQPDSALAIANEARELSRKLNLIRGKPLR